MAQPSWLDKLTLERQKFEANRPQWGANEQPTYDQFDGYMGDDGTYYRSVANTPGVGAGAGGQSYMSYDMNGISNPHQLTGKNFDIYDREGNKSDYQGTFPEFDDKMLQGFAKTAAMWAAAALGGAGLMGAGPFGGTLGGVMGGGAPALTGVDAALADLAASGGLTPSAMGSGLTTTAMGAAPAVGSAAANSISPMASLFPNQAVFGVVDPLVAGVSPSAVSSWVASLGPAAAGGAGAAAAASAAGKAAGSSALQGLAPYLGPAATALGALAGSQPQKNESTQARELPEFLKGPVQDLVTRSQGLLSQQMNDPARNNQLGQFRNSGFGLLNTPVMGNSFNKFYGGM